HDIRISVLAHHLFFSLIPPPPRSTLFPYTTLFRSVMQSSNSGRQSDSLATCPACGRARPFEKEHHDDQPERVPQLIIVADDRARSEEHTSELQSRRDLVCRLLLEKKKKKD